MQYEILRIGIALLAFLAIPPTNAIAAGEDAPSGQPTFAEGDVGRLTKGR